jgi:PAS domain S-box-containing protein
MYNVLYVDDDPNLLEIARYFLESSGEFAIATTTLATLALNLPGFSTFDAIISDYEMPRMDGITFLKKVRETYGDIPFILFTGKGREEVVIQAINNGADFYLQKGGDPTSQFAELGHKIRNAVKRRHAEKGLQESELRYRNLYQYALVGLFETSLKDATVVACNQRYCDLFGFASVADAIGKDVLHLYQNPEDRKIVSRMLHEQGYISNHEVRFVNLLTGQTFWAQFSARINYEKDVAEGTIIDISDRKRAEELLVESQRTISTLMGNLPGMAYRCMNDATWTMEFVSEGCLDLTGYLPSDLTHNHVIAFSDCILPRDRQQVWDTIQQALATHQRFQVIYRIITKGGTEKWVWEQGMGVFSPEGLLVALEGFITDITERKHLEADLEREHDELQRSITQLTAAKQELRAQFNLLADRENTLRINVERLHLAQQIGRSGSWEYDISSNKIWGSAEGLHIFGYPPVAGDFAIENIEDCIPERERVHQALFDLITGGQEYNLEYQINPADGSPPRMIHSVARLERDSLGSPVLVRGVIRDITDQKRAEEALQESEETFHSLVSESTDGIMLIDENGIVIEWNTALGTILGIPREDAIRKRYFELMERTIVPEHRDPELLARIRNEIENALRDGVSSFFSRRLEAGICRPDGIRRRIQQTVFPIKTAKGFRIGSITRDITDQS